MSQEIRAFIAVKIPPTPSLRAVLGSLAKFGNSVKCVTPENVHLTLKFLGDVPETQVPELTRLMQDAATGSAIPEVRLIGLGAFPHLRRPSVIWAGMQGAEPLEAVVVNLELQLQRIGFPPETRGFQPHVTLARVKRKPPDELAELVHRHATAEFGTLTLPSIELFRSELKPDGPKYTALASAAFGVS